MNARKRVLFVDDEPLLLEGLRRSLRSQRDRWQMEFVESGKAALEFLSRQSVDVIVSDLRMPHMNGADLLTEVRHLHPHIVRLALSGEADTDMMMQAAKNSHQLLAKPCDAQQLMITIDQVSLQSGEKRNAELVRITSELSQLPTVPTLYFALEEKMRDPEASVEDIAAMVSRDPAIAASVLKLVNSAYFGIPTRVANIGDAINYLGLDTLRALVLSVHMFSHFEKHDPTVQMVQEIWTDSLAIATGARVIAKAAGCDGKVQDEVFAAGLVHDAGRAVLAANFHEKYASVASAVHHERQPLHVVETHVLGLNHAEVAETLFKIWGLPDIFVEVAARHHLPHGSTTSGFSAVAAVHLSAVWTAEANGTLPLHALDQACFRDNNCASELPKWRARFLTTRQER